MNKFLISAIWLVHLCLILLVIGIPFTPSPYFVMLHTIFVPFMILHWYTNNDTCVLTTAEKYLRDVKTKDDEKDCYTCRLISPIFDFRKNYDKFSKTIYGITIGLWLMSSVKLYLMFKRGSVKTVVDLFSIIPKRID